MTEGVFICPICRAPLYEEGQSCFCRGEKKHCYDIAKEGYVNLLPPGKKSNAATGDDKEMLRSRERFLSLGLYDRISEKAAEAAKEIKDKISLFVDAGSGEGYHTKNIYEYLSKDNASLTGIGLEASKYGAMRGAKKAKGENLYFAAANIFEMPLCDNSADVIFSMFAPVPDEEAKRVLREDGIIVVCSSGSGHLLQMREIIYDEVRISPPLNRTPEGFELIDSRSLKYEITVEKEYTEDLLKMTPFFYRCPAKGKEKLKALERLTTIVETEYKVYGKK